MSTAKKRRLSEPESEKKKRPSETNHLNKNNVAVKSSASTKSHTSTKPTSATVSAECSLYIPIPPIYALDPMSGICDSLNSLVMQYVPQLEGVLLAYERIVPSMSARIINDSPFAHVWVTFQATIWRPSIGQILVGGINQQSPDHIGLLIQGTFNASIPREEITKDYKYNTENEEWTVSLDGDMCSLVSVSGGYVHVRVKEINRDRSGLVSIVGSLTNIDTYGVYSTKFIENEVINPYEAWGDNVEETDYQDDTYKLEAMQGVEDEVEAVHAAESDESDFDTAALTPKPKTKPTPKNKSNSVKTEEEDESSTRSKKKELEPLTPTKNTEKTHDGIEKKKKKKKNKIKTEQK